MQTICPHCQTVFKVSDEHLKIADGYVRCGICKEVFNALEKDQLEGKKESVTEAETTDTLKTGLNQNIPKNGTGSIKTTEPASPDNTAQADMFTAAKKTESAPAPVTITSIEAEIKKSEPAESAPPKTGSPATRTKADAANKPEQQKVNTHTTANDVTSNIAKPPSAVIDTAATASTTVIKNIATTKNITNDVVDDSLFDGFQSKLIPDEYRIPELHNTYSIWQDIAWSLAILALTASLFAEYTWFNRNELISKPQLRPLITQFCDLINCDAMALREPDEIEMTTRNIYSHPNVKNALMISGTLVNHADFEQPYPSILIDFSDVRGEVIASRVFTPENYLQIKTSKLRPLAPRTPINFNMEIQDPGNNAMTYEFSFL